MGLFQDANGQGIFTVPGELDAYMLSRGHSLLWCMADFQVTNDETYNALCGSQLIAADTATGTAGTEISEATGTNVTPDNHHMAFSRTGMLVVATPARRFVNLVVYAGASNAQPGDVMTVDADYGRLNVMRVKV